MAAVEGLELREMSWIEAVAEQSGAMRPMQLTAAQAAEACSAPLLCHWLTGCCQQCARAEVAFCRATQRTVLQ